MLCPFLAAPLARTLGVSWHWQIGINPQQSSLFGAAFSHVEAEQGPSLALRRECHSFTETHCRVSKAENMHTRQAEGALGVLTLS